MVVEMYRQAARKLFNCSEDHVKTYICDPKDDPGEWAPDALAIIYLEHREADSCPNCIPCHLNYFFPISHGECVALADHAGVGYIEYINAAVAAVYP